MAGFLPSLHHYIPLSLLSGGDYASSYQAKAEP